MGLSDSTSRFLRARTVWPQGGGQSRKFTFWGENQFFSTPCGTPLVSKSGIFNSTRPELSNKKNRKSLRRRISLATSGGLCFRLYIYRIELGAGFHVGKLDLVWVSVRVARPITVPDVSICWGPGRALGALGGCSVQGTRTRKVPK